MEKAFKVFRLNMIRTVLEANRLQMVGRETMWNEFHVESKTFKDQIIFKENLHGNCGYGDRGHDWKLIIRLTSQDTEIWNIVGCMGQMVYSLETPQYREQ